MFAEYLSYGSHKKSFTHGPDLVRLEQKNIFTPEETESSLRLATIAHILFPESIPEADSAWIDRHTGKPNYIFEKITHDPEHSLIQKIRQERYEGYPISEKESERASTYIRMVLQSKEYNDIVYAMKEAGFTGYEYAPHNFIRHENGNLVFVDFEPAFRIYQDQKTHNLSAGLECDPKKLTVAISNLKGAQKAVATECYRRIRDLAPQDLKKQFPIL